jgi:DNA polymerase III delta prime subunit
MLQKLRAFMDSTELGTIICTTNNLHKLDEPFKDRFRCLLVERPVEKDWTKRAQEIFASEGVQLTQSEVGILLNGFNGSARSLIDWLEDYVKTLKGIPSSQQSAAPLAKPSGITLKSNKTLVNGRLPNNTQGGQNGL